MQHRKKPTVLLFDLDGTLVNAGGAGRRAMAGALHAVCGAAHAVDGVDMRGMTDLAIFRAALASVGHDPDPELLRILSDRYLELLRQEIALAKAYRVLPGVKTLLESLGQHPGTALGLGTGNLELGARIKLGHGGLDGYFSFGGFGSDHELRAEILRLGAERGAAELGCVRSDCRVVVIGDTPRDVEAGLAIGAEVVAVGTGGYTPERLMAAGARRAFGDLGEPEVPGALMGDR